MNRRSDLRPIANHRWQEAGLFDHLIETAPANKAITYQQLVTEAR